MHFLLFPLIVLRLYFRVLYKAIYLFLSLVLAVLRLGPVDHIVAGKQTSSGEHSQAAPSPAIAVDKQTSSRENSQPVPAPAIADLQMDISVVDVLRKEVQISVGEKDSQLIKEIPASSKLVLSKSTSSKKPKGFSLKSQGLCFESCISIFEPFLACFLVPVSSNLGSNCWAPQSKLAKFVSSPKLARPALTPVSLDLDSSSSEKLVLQLKLAMSDSLPLPGSGLTFPLPPACTDLILRPKFVFPTSLPFLGLALIAPKIELPAVCTAVVLRPKPILSIPPSFVLDLRSANLAPHFKPSKLGSTSRCTAQIPRPNFIISLVTPNNLSKIGEPPTCTDLILCPKFVWPIEPSHLVLGSFSSMTSSDVAVTAKAPSPPSPPIDLSNSDLASTTTKVVEPRIQAVQAR